MSDIKNIFPIAIGLIFVASSIFAFGPAPTPPPDCSIDPANPNYREGCFTPINVGAKEQIKNGSLGVNGFLNNGKSVLMDFVGIGTSTPSVKLDVVGNVRITDGTQGAGKVLTSDASGNASWKATSTLGLGGSGITIKRTTVSLSVKGVYGPVTVYCPDSSWLASGGGFYFLAGGGSHPTTDPMRYLREAQSRPGTNSYSWVCSVRSDTYPNGGDTSSGTCYVVCIK